MAAKNKRQVKKNMDKVGNSESPKITMGDVRAQWDVLFKSAKDKNNAMAALGWAYTNNPYLQNQRVKNISAQPFSGDRSQLEKSLESFSENEQSIRQTSQSLFTNYPLLKLNNLYADILSYRHYFYPKYIESEDIKNPKYKKERRLLSRWLDLLQPKRTFQNIVLKTQWEGKSVYYMRDSIKEGLHKGEKGFDYVYLQELPSEYVKIVGWNTASKFTISFDFTYFWQPGTSPEQFPPIFKTYYEQLNGIIPQDKRSSFSLNPNNLKLDPDVEIYWADNRWFYWHTLPMDECFVFSQDESQAYQIPNTAGLFLQAKDLQDYSYLQQELLQLPLSGVITGTLPMTKQMDGTTYSDGYALGTDAFEFFTNMFNEVAPKGVQLFLNPATDHKFFKFDGDVVNNSTILSNAIQQFNVTAGVGGLNSVTDKPNIMQVKTQQILEGEYVKKMYKQFENCINVWWKNKLNLNYEWRFKMKGMVFTDDAEFSKIEKGLSLGQNYLLPDYLSFFDLTLDDIEALQYSVIESDVYNRLQVLQSTFTQSKQTRISADTVDEMKQVDVSDNKGGRPSLDIMDIESDGTAAAVGRGENTNEGKLKMSLKYCVECGQELDNNAVCGCFCSEECRLENKERIGGE